MKLVIEIMVDCARDIIIAYIKMLSRLINALQLDEKIIK